MKVKASFSASLKNPVKTKNGFKIKKMFFSYWKDIEESNFNFRKRILSSKGINICDCNYTDVLVN